jgi:DNA (cytosine-5)-methyltransferase 1
MVLEVRRLAAQAEPSHIEIFAGAGGMAVGGTAAGFPAAELHELDHRCCETLRWNATSDSSTLQGAVCEGDVREVDWEPRAGKISLLAGGAPCQPFSLAGLHEGHRDHRNLFPEVLKAVRITRPYAIVLENVKGILREGFWPYIAYVLRQLTYPSIERKRGEQWRSHSERLLRHDSSKGITPEYHVNFALLNAADYGVPQSRERVFIFATRADLLPPYSAPAQTHSRQALLRAQLDPSYWEERGLPPERDAIHHAFQLESTELAPWVTVRDALAGLPEPGEPNDTTANNHWLIPGARAYSGHSGSRMDWPSKTIKAGVHGVPGGENTVVTDSGELRYFTLRETARIQTFPDNHFFPGARSHVVRQIGNAVPCRLACAVVKPLHDLMASFDLVSDSAQSLQRSILPTVVVSSNAELPMVALGA